MNTLAKSFLLCWLAVFLAPGVVAGRGQKTLALEGGPLSFSAGYQGESPPASGLQHVGQMDADPAFGLSFEYGIRRFLGIRAGLLTGDVPVVAAGDCPSPDCVFTVGNAMVTVSVADWSVDKAGSFSAYYVEAPFYLRPSDTFELFGGPTVAFINVSGVGAPGLNGLSVNIDTSSSSYGLHAGAGVDLGLGRKWMIGVIARWLPADVDFTVRQPLLPPLHESFADQDDIVSVGLRFGRRFGP